MPKSRSILLIVVLAVLTPSAAAQTGAQSTVFVVRHAERADTTPGTPPTMSADPDLSEAGRARAASLATMLKDANISAIYATEFKRTQQTAAPLAKALGLTVNTLPASETKGLVEQVRAAKSPVLIVGHSNTVPEIVKALGITTPLTVGDTEFDNLFVVTTSTTGGSSLLRLHYR
jgi:broad specificity phosphatase PhoE